MAARSSFFHLVWITAIFSFTTLGKSQSQVLELDDRFPAIKSDGMWFVKFYAPWCGHCRKLEPVWNEVARALSGSNIQVGRVDCTKYSGVGQEFNVKGFPTILFIKGENVFRYNGDRSRDDLVDFAKKAEGPAVKSLSSSGKLRDILNSKEVFFLLVKEGSESSPLEEEYMKVAEKKQTKGSFFVIDKKHLLKGTAVGDMPSLMVVKGKEYIQYQGNVSNENISRWVNQERFPVFGLANRASFYELAQTEKRVVFAVFSEDKGKIAQNRRVGEVTRAVAEKSSRHRSSYHFAILMGDEVVTNIMMGFVALPIVFVYDHQSMVYHYLENAKIGDNFSEEQLTKFLDDITEEKLMGSGGDTYAQRVKRIFYQIWETVHEVWSAHPLLAIVMFGLPTLLFSFLFYTICCAEHVDDDEAYEEYDEDMDSIDRQRDEEPPPYEPPTNASQTDKSKVD